MISVPPPSGLPVEECVVELRAALARGTEAVLQAPPGAGKTTIVPLRLLEEPWLAGDRRRIVVLEPRRLATRAAASRMASLLGEPVGATVGYTTRDERRVSAETRVEVVTEGVLTRRLQRDRRLPDVGLVVFDEVHERNLQTDLAMALVLDARTSHRRDLRLLAMSATLDTERIASLLGGAPVVSSDGREHPVDVRWSPPPPRQRLAEATATAVLRALREAPGDVLVFLPGAADIRRTQSLLSDGDLPDGVDVRPLFGALSITEQDLALEGSLPGRRRVVLSTDIAETSLTVAGVRIVVDAGHVRTPRYDARTGLTKLHTVPISRASADQRAGRAGRTEPGVAYRLWSKLEHAARRPFTDPEIASVDLAGLVLELAVWGAKPGDLRFLDPPPQRAVDEGRSLLDMLGAFDAGGQPTPDGLAMADLPLHPRLARMVVGAQALGLAWTAFVLAALLEDRDVLRGRPDDVPVDIVERVRLIVDRHARHLRADGPAVATARRRAGDLARRLGIEPGGVEADGCGRVLALAYPDRVAQARGGGRFRLRNGSGAWVPKADPLAAEPFLVVAELDADRHDSRIRVAAALHPDDVEAAAGLPAEPVTSVEWDAERGQVRATDTRRVDRLVLRSQDRPAAVGAADTTTALLEQARGSRLADLRWTDAARFLQQRVAFLRSAGRDSWPDLSDDALLATVDEWLVPLLAKANSLRAVDMDRVLRRRLDHRQHADLDRLAPATIAFANGRTVAVDYGDGRPAVAARVQDLFGTTRHPDVAGVPVVVTLLSPAGRPVQVTSDLPAFWAGSYAAVRKDMAGRYPKHPWPVDPAAAQPPIRGQARPRRKR